MKTKTNQKAKEPTLIQKGEEAGFSMTYHGVLLILELFLAGRSFWNLVGTFMNEYSLYRTVDQVIYVVLMVVAICAIWKHDHRTGVIFVSVFAAIDLFFQIFILMETVRLQLTTIDYFAEFVWLGIIVGWCVVTILYYRKRWSLLK